jgi:hypothetical protein
MGTPLDWRSHPEHNPFVWEKQSLCFEIGCPSVCKSNNWNINYSFFLWKLANTSRIFWIHMMFWQVQFLLNYFLKFADHSLFFHLNIYTEPDRHWQGTKLEWIWNKRLTFNKIKIIKTRTKYSDKGKNYTCLGGWRA